MIPFIAERPLLHTDWPAIRHFHQHEVEAACQDGAWGNLDAGSVYALDEYAGYVVRGQRLIESVAFMPTKTAAGMPTATWNSRDTGAHATDSLHYRGRAFDVMFPQNGLATAWLTAVRFPKWGGIGAYPYWRPDPGLHLDTRLTLDDEQGRGFRVLWWVDAAGVYHYLNGEADIAAFLDALRMAA